VSAVAPETSTDLASVGDLASLSVAANREHAEVARAMGEVVQHGIRAGQALLAAKEQIPRGQFWAWVAENFDASDWTAKLYIRFAVYRAELEAEGITNYAEAKALVKHLAAGERISHEEDLARRKEARRLHGLGSSYGAIARELDVDATLVRRWIEVTTYAASRRKAAPSASANHLDDFITGLTRAQRAAVHLNKPAWSKVLETLIERGRKLAAAGRECVCSTPLVDDGLCLRCGKTIVTPRVPLESEASK
jgi:hypothetical protein